MNWVDGSLVLIATVHAMKLPNANHAVIPEAKLSQYLLDEDHPEGGSKAKLLVALGYSATDWRRLEADIRLMHVEEDVVATSDTPWGKRYEIVAPLTGPAGDTVVFRSVWQIDLGQESPRLITMYPE